jgi:hypothetical protein
MSDINWGAPHLVITRRQQLEAAKRVEDFLIAHARMNSAPDVVDVAVDSGVTYELTREDLVVLIRTTWGYHPTDGVLRE